MGLDKYDEKDDTRAEVVVANPNNFDDKDVHYHEGVYGDGKEDAADLGKGVATLDDVIAAEAKVHELSLERTIAITKELYLMHKHDQNFPHDQLEEMEMFLNNPDIVNNPDKYHDLIHRMKIEAILSTDNSPYAIVRAAVDPYDSDVPALTFRVWVIGVFFSGAGAFINQLFSVRNPSISVSSDVSQLLAYPLGNLLARILPSKTFNLFGRSCSLNPGPFNKKEHMLITIMTTVAFSIPYTHYIVFTQALPIFFGQSYAKDFGYQILNSLGTNFVGYGLAGLTRRFLVYPAYCVWPASLSTLALNKAFHSDDSHGIPGPFNRIYTMSRLRCFTILFGIMFVYFWFPGFIFQNLALFNWMAWIKPDKPAYSAIVSINPNVGLGLNPFPTFDWNIVGFAYPLVTPLFSFANYFAGMFFSMFIIIGIWWSNSLQTSYLPINSNQVFDHTAKRYNVTRVLDKQGHFDFNKYQAYSEPWMSAGSVTLYTFFFASYSAAVTYAALYHRHEIARGFKSFWRQAKSAVKRGAAEEEDLLDEDVHWRLMKKYKEVPEWWYLCVLLVSMGLGMAGVAAYPTYTTPAVVIYGVILAIVFLIPIGLITAVTGQQLTLNVLAEFIGACFKPGDALSMNYFKSYGYVTTAHALAFSRDLKMAHYTKIPPRYTFTMQLVATFISTFVCTSLYNFQMGFRNVCTAKADFKFSCPGETTFFKAAVFWGTIGPKRIFTGRYKLMLLGFPLGLLVPVIIFCLQKWKPRNRFLRTLHPVVMMMGGIGWAPYNLAYVWPGLVVTWISWGYFKPRYLAFWGKYNYIVAAAFPAAIAICSIIIFFGVTIPGKEIVWWGNYPDSDTSCDAIGGCPLLPLPDIGYFGRPKGSYE